MGVTPCLALSPQPSASVPYPFAGFTVTKMLLPCRWISSSVGLSRRLLQRRAQVVDRLHRLTIHFLDDVARADAGVGRAAVRVDVLDDEARARPSARRARRASSGVSGATETPSAVLSSLAPARCRRAARRLRRGSPRRASRVRCFSLPSRTIDDVRASSPDPASATRLRSVLVSCTGWPLND